MQWELGVDPWIHVPSLCRTLKPSVVDLDLWLAYVRAHIRLENFPKGTCYTGKVTETKITAGNWIQYKTIDILHQSSRWLIRWFTRNPFQALLMTGAQGSDPQVKGPNSCRAVQARSTGWVVRGLWKASDPFVTWLHCFTFLDPFMLSTWWFKESHKTYGGMIPKSCSASHRGAKTTKTSCR